LTVVVAGGIVLSGCGGRHPAGEGTAHDALAAGERAVDPALFDGGRALEEVRRFVGLGPRPAGTPEARRAAEYLRDRLQALGMEAAIDTFRDAAPGGVCVFRNVVGRIPATGDARKNILILAGHYDTKVGISTNFIGANDSGSSTGVLLELGRVLASSGSPGPEIWIAFLDGEECRISYGPHDGLHGSRHLAKRLVDEGRAHRVAAVIVLDMVGDRDLTVTIPRNGTPWLTALYFRAARELGVRDKFSLFPFEIGDDHQPFLEVGIPALDVIDFEFGSGPGRNDYWHTSADTLDKLAAASLQTVGRVTLAAVNRISLRRRAGG